MAIVMVVLIVIVILTVVKIIEIVVCRIIVAVGGVLVGLVEGGQ